MARATGMYLSDETRKLLREFPQMISTGIYDGVSRVMHKAEADSKSEYFTGRPHLNVVTGRLKQSITNKVTRSGSKTIGQIGTNVVYGRIHELGFSGPVNVPAHSRRISQAFGRAIAPQTISIRAHTKMMKVPKRPFLEPALRGVVSNLDKDIAAAINKRLGR